MNASLCGLDAEDEVIPRNVVRRVGGE